GAWTRRSELAADAIARPHDLHQLLDHELQFVLVCEILADRAVGRVTGEIEPILDVVEPDHDPPDHGHGPEAAAEIAIGLLRPFLGRDPDRFPEALLRHGHTAGGLVEL